MIAYKIFLDIFDYPRLADDTPFDMDIDWGDGEHSSYSDLNSLPLLEHIYSEVRSYPIKAEITNACGTTRKNLVFTPPEVYESDNSAVHDIVSVSSPVSVSPVIVSEYTVLQDNDQVRTYAITTTAEIGVPLIIYPKQYTEIEHSELVIRSGEEEPEHENGIANLQFIYDASLDTYGTIEADKSFSLLFDYKDFIRNSPLFYRTNKVVITGDAVLFDRLLCEGMALSPVLVQEGIYTAAYDFNGTEIKGFILKISEGPEAKIYSVDVNVLGLKGTEIILESTYLDVFPILFLSNIAGITDPAQESILAADEGGEIIIATAHNHKITKCVVIGDFNASLRISSDETLLEGGRYHSILFFDGQTNVSISIAAGDRGVIYEVKCYESEAETYFDSPIHLEFAEGAADIQETYFYNGEEGSDFTKCVAVNNVSIPKPLPSPIPFSANINLKTLYGDVKIRSNAQLNAE